MTPTFVAYLRVSTEKQGYDGLGIEAQREAVRRYCEQAGGRHLGEYVEVESGKVDARPVLAEALAACRAQKATLLIARLDRLGRSVSFIAGLMDARVAFVAADMPFATPLVLHVMAAFAQHEREQIAARTKASLAAAKVRGVKLGSYGATLALTNRTAAERFAATVRHAVEEARAQGATTLQSIADHLNKHSVHAREGGCWHPASVSRLLRHLAARPSPGAKLANS